jgi:CMP-N-acetylneuraminic acid synthetase
MKSNEYDPRLTIPPIASLVPMKIHSERVPGKNVRPLCGKPLFHWILASLIESRYIDRIFIDTDSQEIAEKTVGYPKVIIIHRPEHLKGDMFVANDLIEYDLSQISEYDFFLQTHSTNPLLKSETIDRAITTFFSQADHDSLLSVTVHRTRLFWEDGSPVNHDVWELIRTQDLSPILEENSCIYLFSRSSFKLHRNRIGEKPLLFQIDPSEAWDIDEEMDFSIADFLMGKRMNVG